MEVRYYWFDGNVIDDDGKVIGKISSPCRMKDDQVFFIEFVDPVPSIHLEGKMVALLSPIIPEIPWDNMPAECNGHAFDPYGDGYFCKISKMDDSNFTFENGRYPSGLKLPYGVDWRVTVMMSPVNVEA